MSSNEPIVNLVDLARCLKGRGRSPVSRSFIYAMKRAGYEFTHGKLTTVGSARQWLAANPEFRTTSYFDDARTRKEKPMAQAV
jgi:hypothetical protein